MYPFKVFIPKNLQFNILILCLILLQVPHSYTRKLYSPWFHEPSDSVEQSSAILAKSTEQSSVVSSDATDKIGNFPETAVQPDKNSTGKTKEQSPDIEHCEALPNGTEVCRPKCGGGVPLECTNSGVCVLDSQNVPVCSCKHTEDYIFTGPHCEHPVEKTSPSLKSHHRRFVIIILGAAGLLIATLFILNIAIFCVRNKREQRKGNKSTQHHIEFEVRTLDNERSHRSAVWDLSDGIRNEMYFEGISPREVGLPRSLILDDYTHNSPTNSTCSPYSEII